MKQFAHHLAEKLTSTPQWTNSAWRHILGEKSTGRRPLPFTSALINKIWKTPIRATVFHITDTEGATHVLQNQRKKGVALSVMAIAPKIMSRLAESGVWRAGVVLKLEANILMAGMSDIMSVPDVSGRRWLGIPEVARTLPGEFKREFQKEMEAAHKKVFEGFVNELGELAVKISSDEGFITYIKSPNLYGASINDVMTFPPAAGTANPRDIVNRINNFRNSIPKSDEAQVNRILGYFVREHIEATTKVLEKYFMESKERIQQIADGKGGGMDGSEAQTPGSGYSELVANEYRVTGIAWMPYMAKWGIGEDKMRAAAGSVPILVVARKAADDSMHFKDTWFPPEGQTPEERQVRAAYRVFARKAEIPWWTPAGKKLAKSTAKE